MKKLEKKSNSKRNIMTIIRSTGILFAIIAFAMACGGPNTDATVNQDSIDSAKAAITAPVDTAATPDSTIKK